MELGDWQPGPSRPHLPIGAVHVWRISIGPDVPAEPFSSVLSRDEQARATRFVRAADQIAYVITHGASRILLAAYEQSSASELRFTTGTFGKPALADSASGPRLEFNLSHSGHIALLAVARDRAVGVDIAKWDIDIDHMRLAERYFSPLERETLRALADAPDQMLEGFFSAWSRKEAYVKATGYGMSRGLDHFDVSLAPHEPAALIADREDHRAGSRWRMFGLRPGVGYSAALVAAAPTEGIRLFEPPVGLFASRHAPHASA